MVAKGLDVIHCRSCRREFGPLTVMESCKDWLDSQEIKWAADDFRPGRVYILTCGNCWRPFSEEDAEELADACGT